MNTPPDPDRGPSPRIILAAILLREGHDLDDVAELTGVPAALLTLALHEPRQQRAIRSPGPPHPRRVPVTVALIEAGAIVNAIASVLAITRHNPVLALLSSAGAVLLTVTLWHLAQRRTTAQVANSSQLTNSEGLLPAWPIHGTQPSARPRGGNSNGRVHRGWWRRW